MDVNVLAEEEHLCKNTDRDYVVCIDGEIWGYCESEFCYGACEKYYLCECACHDKED